MKIIKLRDGKLKYLNFREQKKTAKVYHYKVNNTNLWFVVSNKTAVKFVSKPKDNMVLRDGDFNSSAYSELSRIARTHNLNKIRG